MSDTFERALTLSADDSLSSLPAAGKCLLKCPRHRSAVGLVSQGGIVSNELLKGAHDLAPFEIRGGAISPLYCIIPVPGESAREGARDHLGDHPHAEVLTLPTFKQPPRGYIRAVGQRRRHDQRCEKGAY